MEAAGALAVLLVATSFYSLATLAAVLRFVLGGSRTPLPGRNRRRVSVLIPAVGAKGTVVGGLRSLSGQHFPASEVLVGASPGDSEVREAVRSVAREYPDLSVRSVDCPDPEPATNGKVAVLHKLGDEARERVWVVMDADIRAPAEHLGAVTAELLEEETGLVTCLYRAVPGTRLASRLQATRINTEFVGQTLVARLLLGLQFGLGATLAFRASSLERIGGFQALLHVLGDDYHLGQRISALGLRTEISSVTVSTHLPHKESTLDTWRREVRWARTIRKQRPWAYATLPVTFSTLWVVTGLVLLPQAVWPLAAGAAALRLVSGASAALAAGDAGAFRRLWLVPLSDLWGYAAWLSSYFGNSVTWNGKHHRLGPGGRIQDSSAVNRESSG